METLLLVGIPSLTIFLFLWGLYKLFLEEKVQAQENILQVLAPYNEERNASKAPFKRDSLIRQRIANPQSALYRLEVLLEQANWSLQPKEFLMLSFLPGIIVPIIFCFFHLAPFLILLGAGVGLFLPFIVLKLKRWLRFQKALAQFPDILDALVNCFKTGYGLSRSIQLISNNYEDPWGTEFGKMAVELNLGATLEEATESLNKRIPSMDIALFSTTLLIQKETGGNLTELLENLSKTCRDRIKLYRKVHTIAAQGKLSASVVSCIPFFLLLIMYVFLPGPVAEFMVHPLGILLMSLAGLWMLFGIFVLFKLVRIEV